MPERDGVDPRPSVLVVDDDAPLRKSMRRALELHNYGVREAESARDARRAIDEEKPALLIMDLVLPGIQGREAANLVLAHHPDLPVLYISGCTNQESRRMGHLTEGQAFLRKPFDVQELLAAVDHLFA